MAVLERSSIYEQFPDEEFKHMPSADGVSSSILQHYLLGDVSAKNEWSNQPEIARSTFVHLAAYKHFINYEQLMLLGRTGSGKSAIMYRLKDDIENNNIKNYTDVIQIDEKDFCEKLAEICYNIDIDRFDSTNKITKAVVMAIYIKIMLYCFEKFPSERKKLSKTVKFLLLNGYIKLNDSSIIERIEQLSTDDFFNKINEAQENNALKMFLDVSKILLKAKDILQNNNDEIVEETNGYKKALKELSEFLSESNRKILILLDSFDEYKINDKQFVIAMRSLILACFEIYSYSKEMKIYFKMAIASEIYTRVLTHLPAKNHTNTVAILWSYKELMKCMALRFVSWYHDPNAYHSEYKELFTFLNNYKVSDLKGESAYINAESVFYHIIPKVCKTNSSYTYWTLAFISRHTMKKPREIMQIFNAIIDRIIYENDNTYFIKENESYKIKDIVHSLQNDFIKQNLTMYELFVPNIHKYINNLLYRRRFIFSIAEIDFENKLKEVNAMLQADAIENEYLNYFDKVDILNIVFETGLLGKVSEVRTLDASNIELFGIDKPIKIIDALFEYQFKGKIQRNKEIQYVIHPMCYEHFNCEVGMRSMVNTDSYDSTELLASIISKE